MNPSRDEFIRALGNVLDAYDHERDATIPDRICHEAHVAEARKLMALVLSKAPPPAMCPKHSLHGLYTCGCMVIQDGRSK